MAKKNNVNQRLDPDFIQEMKELADMRYFKKLAEKLPTPAKMTKLLLRTEGWKMSKEELKLKPERKK